MKRKLALLLVGTMLVTAPLVGCAGNATPAPSAAVSVENQMQYINREDLKKAIDDESSEYVLLDVRKKADFDAKHIVGAYSADVDAARSGDDESGITNLKAAIEEATGSELGGEDDKFVLICYSGKSYAQKATDLLIEMGVASENIFTLEGGNNGWAEAGDSYTSLME